MPAQTITSELFRTVALSVFLPSLAGRDAFLSGPSDIVVLRVESDNKSTIYIMIMEHNSNRSCLIDSWDYPLSIRVARPANVVSWGLDCEHLRLLVIFPTAEEADRFWRAVLLITLGWLDEQDDETLSRLEAEVEAPGGL